MIHTSYCRGEKFNGKFNAKQDEKLNMEQHRPWNQPLFLEATPQEQKKQANCLVKVTRTDAAIIDNILQLGAHKQQPTDSSCHFTTNMYLW